MATTLLLSSAVLPIVTDRISKAVVASRVGDEHAIALWSIRLRRPTNWACGARRAFGIDAGLGPVFDIADSAISAQRAISSSLVALALAVFARVASGPLPIGE